MKNLEYFPLILVFTLLISVCHSQDGFEFAEEGFVKELVTDEIDYPTGITFDDNGQGYIWTKHGMVHVMTADGEILPEAILDISEEVGDSGDHGLLGFALDPNFTENGYFYLSYKVERNYLLYYGTPDYDPNAVDVYAASIARVTRYTADVENNFQSVDEDSRFILLGEDKTNAIPILHHSHGIGTLAFGEDGSLLVGAGDGATWISPYVGGGPPYYEEFAESAINDSIIPPEQEVGSYRAQLVQSYSGKIHRINPATGEGYPSNPFYDPVSPNSAQSKVWSMGFRNPFRFRLRPGTGSADPSDADPGTIFVGDVGLSSREEVNIVDSPGKNFGWPHFEGILPHLGFVDQMAENPYAENPLSGQPNCNDHFLYEDLLKQNNLNPIEFNNPCDPTIEIQYPFTFEHSLPSLTYEHAWSDPEGTGYVPIFDENGAPVPVSIASPASGIEYTEIMTGAACIAGDFYMGSTFPQEYHELFFIADYNGWMKAIEISENGELQLVKDFLNQIGKPIIHIEYNPHDEALYIVESGQYIQKIYYGQNENPVAIIEASETYGTSPLTVELNGSESFSPIESEITYEWTVDGETYTEESFVVELTSPSAQPEEVPVSLVVTDEQGRTDSTSLSISLNNTPPEIQIAPFSDGEHYPVDIPSGIPLTVFLTDTEEDATALSTSWTTFLHHNEHFHTDITDDHRSSATTLSTIGCGEEVYYYRLKVEAQDSYGLRAVHELELYPYCGNEEIPLFTEISYEDLASGVRISWQATHPENIDRLIVFKGKTQLDIYPTDTLEINGNANLNSFIDFEPGDIATFYALKILTEENVFRFSTVEKVINREAVGEFILFPNPADELVTLMSKNFTGTFTVAIFNMAGQRVREYSGTNNEDHIELQIPVSNLAEGLYVVRMKTNDFSGDRKLVISHD